MNVTRTKESFTGEEIAELQLRLADWKRTNGYSWSTVERETGVPAGTASVWVTGSYKGDNARLAAEVSRFFLHRDEQAELSRDAPIEPAFQPTETARRITGTLQWAHRSEVVVIVGAPGTGKTMALENYAGSHPNTWLATLSPSCGSLNATLLGVLRAMGIRRKGGVSHLLTGLIREKVAGRQSLIIIDEAQNLSEDAIEELRGLHDETKVGLALVGNPDVLNLTDGTGPQAAFAQRHSRVGIRMVLDRPDPKDVETLLAAWSVEDAAQRTFLRGLALKPGGGGVRHLTKVLKYATVLAQAGDETLQLDHLKDARLALATRGAVA